MSVRQTRSSLTIASLLVPSFCLYAMSLGRAPIYLHEAEVLLKTRCFSIVWKRCSARMFKTAFAAEISAARGSHAASIHDAIVLPVLTRFDCRPGDEDVSPRA